MFSSYWGIAEDEKSIFRIYVISLPISIYTRVLEENLDNILHLCLWFLSARRMSRNRILVSPERKTPAEKCAHAEGRNDALPMLALTSPPRPCWMARYAVGYIDSSRCKEAAPVT